MDYKVSPTKGLIVVKDYEASRKGIFNEDLSMFT